MIWKKYMVTPHTPPAVIFKSEWEEKDWFRFGYGYGETHGK